MASARRFSELIIGELDKSKIIGIRAGDEHRYTGIWCVVVRGRVFVRSWNDKAQGWRRAFLNDPRGAVQTQSGRQIAVRARAAAGERLLVEIDAAYAKKYHTPASMKWVRGLNRGKRRSTTTELLPL